MKDDVVQLLARGQQDIWLTGNPEVSFYRSSFRRHVPFASSIERFLVPHDGKVLLNPKCDMLGYVYLTAHDKTSGALVPGLDWSTILSTVELIIGNQTVATHDMTYINQIRPVLEAETYSKRAQTSFQPLGFFFDSRPLPLVALRYTDVKIILSLLSTQYYLKVWAHCIHLDEDERRYFSTTPQKILIPQVQRFPISKEPFFKSVVKYLAAPCVNYLDVYSPVPSIPPGFVNWGSHIGGSSSVTNGRCIVADNFGGIYTMGFFNSTPLIVYGKNGSPSGVTVNYTNSVTSFNDCFVVKYSSSGNVQWGARIESDGGTTAGNFAAVNTSGNLYIVGTFLGATLSVFDKNDQTTGVSITPAFGGSGCFLAIYDTNGTPQWAACVGGPGGITQGLGIAIDSFGSLYATGNYTASPVTFYNSNGSPFATTITNLGSNDCFIVKYSSNGNVQWGARIGGAGIDAGNSISTDTSGNVYVTGRFQSTTLTFYNSDGSSFATTLTNLGSNDCFIGKYDTNGNVQWVALIAGTIADIGNCITTDKTGSVYVTGSYTSNPLSFYNKNNGSAFSSTLANLGSTDCFIGKYDTNGNVQWVARVGGSGNDIGNGITTDATGNVYVTGSYTSSPVSFYNKNNGPAFATTLTTLGSTDCFIVKYDTNGNVQSCNRIAGTSSDVGYSVTTDTSGGLYVTGTYQSDPLGLYNSDKTLFSPSLSAVGPQDTFICKITA
jgi:hypothetical protein